MLETEPQIVDQYIRPGTVRLVYRHLLQLGERSELLAEAAECAADQDRFWELRRAIYARYNQLYGDTLAGVEAAASEIGADPQALRACLDAATHEAAVRADDAAASAEGVRSRPVFVIGEQRIIGAQPFATFQELLDRALGA
ncbi:MAG: thioredoxin domain-containing protein [Chloroflexi bacterium]|nr:thioredoxin domain-containing protein [Chloroflexota bacterium]